MRRIPASPNPFIPSIGASLSYDFDSRTWNVREGMDGKILFSNLSKPEAMKKAGEFIRNGK